MWPGNQSASSFNLMSQQKDIPRCVSRNTSWPTESYFTNCCSSPVSTKLDPKSITMLCTAVPCLKLEHLHFRVQNLCNEVIPLIHSDTEDIKGHGIRKPGSSPAIMQIRVELAASKGFFAECILEYCPKSNKKWVLQTICGIHSIFHFHIGNP